MKNLITNPNFLIDQVREGGAYAVPGPGGVSTIQGPDGWTGFASPSGAYTFRRATDPDNPALKCLKIECTAAPSNLAAELGYYVMTCVEGYDLASLGQGTAGAQQVTLRFRMRFPAGVYSVSFVNEAEDRSYVGEVTQNTSGAWEEKTVTLTLDDAGVWNYTNGIGMYVTFCLAAGTPLRTANLNAWQAGHYHASANQSNFMVAAAVGYIGKVSMVPGAVALDEPQCYADDLFKCQRYARKSYSQGTPVGTATRVGEITAGLFVGGDSYPACAFPLVPVMCRPPAVTGYSPINGAAGYFRDAANNNVPAHFSHAGAGVAPGDSYLEAFTLPGGGSDQRGWSGHYYANARIS